MNNKDIIQRFLFENVNVRGEMVRLNRSFQTIMEQHEYPPLIQRILGQFLAVASLLSAIIKFEGRLTVQFRGHGGLKLLLAQCNDAFHLRGLAQWEQNFTEETLLSELQKGILIISINHEATGKRYQGIVAWQGNSIAQSIEGYFKDSEQLSTRIWLAVNETTAAGFLLQAMPKEAEKHTQEESQWEHLTCLAETITAEELLTLPNETLLHRLFSQEQVRIFDPVPIMFHCGCSVKRSENIVLLLGQKDAEEILQEKQVVAVTCEFCNKIYEFDRVDVANIFKNGDSYSSKQIH